MEAPFRMQASGLYLFTSNSAYARISLKRSDKPFRGRVRAGNG